MEPYYLYMVTVLMLIENNGKDRFFNTTQPRPVVENANPRPAVRIDPNIFLIINVDHILNVDHIFYQLQ